MKAIAEEVGQGRPDRVRTAIFLMGLSFAAQAGQVVVAEIIETSDPVLWAIFTPMYAVWAAVIVAIWKGRRWARQLALWVVASSLALYAAVPDLRPASWSDEVPTLTSLAIDALAVYLLYTGPSSEWFRSRARPQTLA